MAPLIAQGKRENRTCRRDGYPEAQDGRQNIVVVKTSHRNYDQLP